METESFRNVGKELIYLSLALAGYCEHGNERFYSITGSTFPDWLSNYQLLKKDSCSWSYLEYK
jgi:hypothetical protein